MAYREIKIANAGDLQADIDLLRCHNIIKRGGVWELGHKEVGLNSHLFNTLCFLGELKLTLPSQGSKFYDYKLQAWLFDKDEKYYKQLSCFTYNRKFWALYDVKYDRIFPVAECTMHVKCLILQREWNYQFKQIFDTVLVWASYEEGQYDAIR